jgi:hypothetical protein
MRIFVDESGSFSWSTPGISLMAALVIPNVAMDSLTSRFLLWKSAIVGESGREIKGSGLTSGQLESFVQQVLPSSEHVPLLTVVGADTATTQESHFAMAKDQLSQQYAHIARQLLERIPPNKPLAQAYTELSGWTRNRSAVNFLWIATAERGVTTSSGFSSSGPLFRSGFSAAFPDPSLDWRLAPHTLAGAPQRPPLFPAPPGVCLPQ